MGGLGARLVVEWLRRRTAHESTVVVHKSLMLLQIMLESHKALLLPKLLQNEAIISDLSFLTVCTLSRLSNPQPDSRSAVWHSRIVWRTIRRPARSLPRWCASSRPRCC